MIDLRTFRKQTVEVPEPVRPNISYVQPYLCYLAYSNVQNFGYHAFAHADLLRIRFAQEGLLRNVCSLAFLLTGMIAQEVLLRKFCSGKFAHRHVCSGRFARESLLTGMFAHRHFCSPACLLT